MTSFLGVFLPPIPLHWQFLLYKSWHFGATYPPFLAKVVCERPLRLSRKQTALFFPHSLNHVFVFATLHLFLGYTVSQKKINTIVKYKWSCCLMRLSLLRFLKNSTNLPYANFGLFYFISATFLAKVFVLCDFLAISLVWFFGQIWLMRSFSRTKSRIRQEPSTIVFAKECTYQ